MSQQPRLPLWFLVANWVLLVLAFAAGALLGGRQRTADLPQPQATALELIHAEILKSHVEPQDGNELLDRALEAMVGSLDEYSRYVPPAKVASYVESSTGRYEGVGMVMSQQGEDLVVLYPFVGSPAEAGGVQPGDRILSIDGKLVAELPAQGRSTAATELVRGPADSDVRLQVARASGTADLTLHRGPVQTPVVKWAHLADPDERLGYVYLSDFHPGVAAELANTIAALGTGAGGALRGLIVDLRFNGGGSLDECIAIANLFLPSGVIVSTRRRDQLLEEFRAEAAKCRFSELPLVLLVNEHSASASEVLAGALQDHERAGIVGVRTFGKGYVNTVYTWKDMPFRLKLTTAHYYTPKGRNIDRPHARHGSGNGSAPEVATEAGGIAPDVVAAIEPAALQATLDRLATRETPAPYLAAFAAVAAKYGIPVPEPPKAAEDSQLATALQTLRQRADKQPR